MPTVLTKNGFKFIIFPNDHEPPHLHVQKGDSLVIIEIESLDIRSAVKVSPSELGMIEETVLRNREFFIAKWKEIHG